MTEKSDLDLLYEAADLCKFDARAGWPDRIELRCFIRLMAGGGPKVPAWRLKNAQVTDAIKAGKLEIVNVLKEVEVAIEPDRDTYAGPLYPKIDRYGRQTWCRFEKRSVIDKQYVDREACREWLRACKIAPPPHIRAWLDTAPAENPKRRKLRAILQRIKGLDPGNMPGQKIDFHALAIVCDKSFQVSLTTFADYLDKPASLPKLCVFRLGSERNPDFYRSVCNQIGVSVADYDRALRDLEKQKASAKAKRGHGGKK